MTGMQYRELRGTDVWAVRDGGNWLFAGKRTRHFYQIVRLMKGLGNASRRT
jgi:hypothetical protein